MICSVETEGMAQHCFPTHATLLFQPSLLMSENTTYNRVGATDKEIDRDGGGGTIEELQLCQN
jgi:hypothetical protein